MRFNLLTNLSIHTKLSTIKPLTTAAIAIVALGTVTTGAQAKTFLLTPVFLYFMAVIMN